MTLGTHVKKSSADNNAAINALKLELEKLENEYKNILYKQDLEISQLEKKKTKQDSIIEKLDNTIKDLDDELSEKTEIVQNLRMEHAQIKKRLQKEQKTAKNY